MAQTLPEKHRDILLKYLETRTVQDVAKEIGIARNTLANVLGSLPVQAGSVKMVTSFVEMLRERGVR